MVYNNSNILEISTGCVSYICHFINSLTWSYKNGLKCKLHFSYCLFLVPAVIGSVAFLKVLIYTIRYIHVLYAFGTNVYL